MKKTLFMLLSGLFVILVAGGLFLFMQMDDIAKRAIEKYGSAIVGTQVTVGKVNISPGTGEGTVTQIQIDNPTGFTTPYAFKMDSTKVTVDAKTVTSDVVIIDEIVMDNPDIVYEVAPKGNNFGVLRMNANKYMSSGDAGSTDSFVDSKQIIIKDFYLRNGKVKVIAPSLQNKSFTVSIPTIHLSNLGKDQGKGNMPKIMESVVTIITNTVVSAVGNVTIENFAKFLPNTVTGVANGVLNETGTALQNMGQGIGEMFDGNESKAKD